MIEAGMEQIRVTAQALAPDVYELAIEGSLDWSNFVKVESALEDLFKKGIYKIVVNMKGMRYISSAGFGCFISSLDTAMKNNGNFVFASTPGEIKDVFNILGLSKILSFSDSLDEAVGILKK